MILKYVQLLEVMLGLASVILCGILLYDQAFNENNEWECCGVEIKFFDVSLPLLSTTVAFFFWIILELGIWIQSMVFAATRQQQHHQKKNDDDDDNDKKITDIAQIKNEEELVGIVHVMLLFNPLFFLKK